MQPQEMHWLETQPMQVIAPRERPVNTALATTSSRLKNHKRKKAEKQPWSFRTRLTWQGAVAVLVVAAAWGIKAAGLPLSEPVVATLKQTVTYDTDVDGVLGKLYFVKSAQPPELPSLSAPAMGRVTARFGEGRESIAVLCTEDAYARASLGGVVEDISRGENGYAVTLRHDGGLITSYYPLEAALVQAGQSIQQGAPLGVVASGEEGRVLEFTLICGGQAVDPLAALWS